MEFSDYPSEPDQLPVTDQVATSKAKRYLVAAALLAGGVTVGAVFSPIGLANAQSDGTTGTTTADSTTASTDSGTATTDNTTSDSVDDDGDGDGHHGHFGCGSFEDVATIVGLSTDELKTELEAGKTLAQVAQAQGIAKSDLVSQMVAKLTERVNQAVTDGRIDQTQANTMLADAEARIGAMVDQTPPLGGRHGGGVGLGGFGGRGLGGLRGELTDLAATLGLDVAAVQSDLAEGKTLAEAAGEQSVRAETLTDALVKAATTHIDKALADGRIDQAQADEMKANLNQRVTDMINGVRLQGHGGFGHGGFGHRGGSDGFGRHSDDSSTGSGTTANGETQESSYTA